MKVITNEATVENGQIKLADAVRLPEHARVFVVVPGLEEAPRFYVGSPRLAQPERAVDFVMDVVEEPQDADVTTFD